MNSMSKSAKVTDHFKQSRADAARAPVTRGKAAAAAAAPVAAAAVAVPPAQDMAAASAADQDAADEAALRQFDLDQRFGPCMGITRLERWERAVKLGLNPPPEVPELVQRHGAGSKFNVNLFHHDY